MISENTGAARRDRRKQTERLLAIAALVTLLIAWWIGAVVHKTDVQPFLKQALPQADRFAAVSDKAFTAYAKDALLGYVSIGEATGYGGPIKVAVAVGPQGKVLGTAVIENSETPSYFSRVISSKLPKQLLGKPYTDSFTLGEDLDGITGATYTSRALAAAVLQGTQIVATQQLGLPVSPASTLPIKFGLPELTLLALYGAVIVQYRVKFKYARHLRWAMMLTGMLVLGFWFNVPLTISRIDSLLLGYWSQWQTNVYWFLLVGGLLLAAIAADKNAYCTWFCPFGAVQECMGVIGGAKFSPPRRYRQQLLWLQRGLAWLAVMLAFLFRNPGISSYEVSGTLFSLSGSSILLVAPLALMLLLSLFVRRPWCNSLCPVRPIYDLIHLLRAWVEEIWQRTKRSKAIAPSN